MSHPELSIVPLAHITATHRWDIHPFLGREIPAALNRSLLEAGILHPPLLLERDSGGFEILDGRKRVQAAREILNLHDCPALVVPPACRPQDILSLLLASQDCCAPLSPMETACFLEICAEFLAPEEISNLFLPRLTGRNNRALLPRYRRLLALEPGLQKHVHHGFIAEATALEMLQLQAEDRTSLAALFVEFQMGGGKQRRFFSLARDVAMRADTTITALLAQSSLQEILRHRQMNAPQKVQSLLAILQQMASPALHRDEQSFKARISTLDLPPSCNVVHSQAFEMDEVILSIRFENIDRLQAASAGLVQALKDSGFSGT